MKVTTRQTLAILTTTVAAFFASASPSQAAIITWIGGAQQIVGDADVSTNGTLVGAFNIGESGVSGAVVNGVNFQSFAVPTLSNAASVGNFSLQLQPAGSDIFLSDNGFYGSPSSPFASLSAGYQTLLSSATITAQPTTFDLTMSGLTIGAIYEFQWWSNLSGSEPPQAHGASAGNSINLIDNTSGLEGGLGQFAIGRFTADSASQVINFAPVPPSGSQAFAQLNAFQLRSVPETSSVLAGILPLGVLLVGFLVRRRSAVGASNNA